MGFLKKMLKKGIGGKIAAKLGDPLMKKVHKKKSGGGGGAGLGLKRQQYSSTQTDGGGGGGALSRLAGTTPRKPVKGPMVKPNVMANRKPFGK